MLSPSDTIGSGCSIQELQNRYPTEDIRDPVMHDNNIQDRELQQLMEKYRVQHWHEVCQEEAKKVIEEEVQAKAVEEKATKEIQDKLDETLSSQPVKVGNGRLEEMEEGAAEDQQSEAEAFEADADDDGDVEMS